MDLKKSPRADLTRFSTLFMMLGLVLVLFASWRAIEYKKYDKSGFGDQKWDVSAEELDKTIQIQKELPKPKPKQIKKVLPEKIEQKEDNEDIPEPELQSTDTDEDESIDEPEDLGTVDEPEDTAPVAFQFVEQLPMYPGCEKYKDNHKKLMACITNKIQRFVNRQFDQSVVEDIDLDQPVMIFIQFVIDKDGKITDVKARAARYKALAEEAKRVVSKLPRMKPGMQRGKPVEVTFNMHMRVQPADD